MKTRKTDYGVGTLLEITDEKFHDYKIGDVVKVINSDWHSYHVVNVIGDRRFWWVNEEQLKPVTNKE